VFDAHDPRPDRPQWRARWPATPLEVGAGAGGPRSQWGRVVDVVDVFPPVTSVASPSEDRWWMVDVVDVFPPVTAVASPNEDRWWMSADADIHHG